MSDIDDKLTKIQQQMLNTLHVDLINGDTVDSVVWMSALEEQIKQIKKLMADEFMELLYSAHNEEGDLYKIPGAKVKDWRAND